MLNFIHGTTNYDSLLKGKFVLIESNGGQLRILNWFGEKKLGLSDNLTIQAFITRD